MKKISILGCGWLGLPLGEYLITEGYVVKGSVRTKGAFGKLEARGIESYFLSLDPELKADSAREFLSSGILIVNFPPERRSDIVAYHTAQIKSLIRAVEASPVEYVLFVSSTSVYPNVNREVTEDDELKPEKDSGAALLEAERMLHENSNFTTTVLRFGGLIGYDRMPGRFLAGKKEISNGEAPVNLIHRDDCIGVIDAVIKNGIWGETLNACADSHPLRKDYYIAQARNIGLEPPQFTESPETAYKIVNSDKLKKLTGYVFKYPDPREIPGV